MSFWDSLQERLANLGEDIVEWAIIILVALVVLVIGRFIIRILRSAIEKVLGTSALNPVWEKSGVARALEGSNQTPASLTASVAYAYLMVALLTVVARILHLTTIAELLQRLLAWIPLVLVAAAIVVISASVGNWTANLVKPFADDRRVPWLTWLVRVGILVFGTLFALDLLNIEFAADIVMLVVGGFAVAMAIAFGVGGIDAGKQWWAKYGTPKTVGTSTPPTQTGGQGPANQ
jgi:Mechanosensitive ion channel, conserved TM helix